MTEQEVVEDIADRVGRAAATADLTYAAQSFRLGAALQVAQDRRTLEARIARHQLAADLGEAGVVLAATDAPAQARGQFAAALSQALSRYQQALSQAYGQWSQEASAAWGRLMQEASTTLQQGQQDVSAALQASQQALQSPDLQDMPPIVDGTLPRMGDAETEGDPLAEAGAAVDDSRARYRADLAQAFGACDDELAAALAMPAGADMTSALRKAIQKLKINVLDRHDQYESEVRAAVRKAVLTVID